MARWRKARRRRPAASPRTEHMQEPGPTVPDVAGAPEVEQTTREAQTGATPDPPDSDEPSTFELARRILVGVVQAVEDGANLVGASLREELGRFREDAVRTLIAVAFLATGGGLTTAGIALLLHRWIGSWSPVLLVMGGVYLVAGFWLLQVSRAKGGDE